jgi:hypothetical protein
MNSRGLIIVAFVTLAGCTTAPDTEPAAARASAPTPAPEKINWEEVDKSTARVKERKNRESDRKVTTTETVEQGFLPMSDDEYVAALTSATEEVRKANPKMSDWEVDTEARKRADEAKRQYENSFRTRASTSTKVEWSSP